MKNRNFLATLFFLTLATFNFSCKQTTTSETESSESTETKSYDIKITAKDIQKLNYTEYVLSDLAKVKTQNWIKFQELSSQIEILKKGELSFFQDDKTLLETFLSDLKSEIPSELNIPSILVRLNVLDTTVHKLEGISELGNLNKDTVLNYIKDLLVAYTNLIFQINKKLEKDAQKIIKPI